MDKTGAGKYNAYETECYANGGTLNSSGTCSVNFGSPAVATNNFALFNSLKDLYGARCRLGRLRRIAAYAL